MKKKKKKTIPRLNKKKINQIKKKIKEIEEKLNAGLLKHEKSVATQTELAISNGKKFWKLKKYVKLLGKSWETYINKKYRHIASDRTIQRWMRISKWVDLKKTPQLAYITIDGLDRLIGMVKARCKKEKKSPPKNLQEFFSGHDIELPEGEYTYKSIQDLRLIFSETIDEQGASGVWIESKSGNVKNADPLKKIVDKSRRIAKKNLKKLDKIEFSELKHSITRSINNLAINLGIFLFFYEKIVYGNTEEHSIPFDLSRLDNVITYLQIVQSRLNKQKIETKLDNNIPGCHEEIEDEELEDEELDYDEDNTENEGVETDTISIEDDI